MKKQSTKNTGQDNLIDTIARGVARIEATMATKAELAEVRLQMATKSELAEVKLQMATKDDLKAIKERVIGIEQQNDDIKTAIDVRDKGEIPDLQSRVTHLETDIKSVKKQIFKTI